MTIYKDSRTKVCGDVRSEVRSNSEHTQGIRSAKAISLSASEGYGYVPTKGFRGTDDQAEYAELIEACRLKGTGGDWVDTEDENDSAEENAEATAFGGMARNYRRGGGERTAYSRKRKGGTGNLSFERMMLLLAGLLIISGAATGAMAWGETAEAVSGSDIPVVLSSGFGDAPHSLKDSVVQTLRSAAPFFAAIAVSAFFPLGGIMSAAALFLFGMGLGFGACYNVAEADFRCWLMLAVYAIFTVFSLIMLAKDSFASAGELFRHGYAEGSKKGKLSFFIRAAAYLLLLAAGGVVRWCVALL
ncbi:MAG: hypothetical protein E7559_07110 [Ruminococcaceae bacterium]|nr:hypothetical protein [Oscillospiraceae bacterium]